MDPKQLHILQHSLGLDKYGRGTFYRNHFVTGEGSYDHADCMALVESRIHGGSQEPPLVRRQRRLLGYGRWKACRSRIPGSCSVQPPEAPEAPIRFSVRDQLMVCAFIGVIAGIAAFAVAARAEPYLKNQHLANQEQVATWKR